MEDSFVFVYGVWSDMTMYNLLCMCRLAALDLPVLCLTEIENWLRELNDVLIGTFFCFVILFLFVFLNERDEFQKQKRWRFSC